ncbi:MAG: sigma-70 family RNA polymerase sigma factor [Kiritimatiellae bacterium]|nr:sigma-70 family RNA polymerase sigma factor [Kiritimatiellia bacterium]
MATDPNDTRSEVIRLAIEHRARIWGYLMGLTKDPYKAEDLLQNTYVVVYEKWDRYTLGTNFLAWVLTIARNQFLMSVDPKRHPLVATEMDVLERVLSEAAAEERTDVLAARREALSVCLGKLRSKDRRVMELRYAEGLSCMEIAKQVGASLNGLYSLLSRLRDLLRDCVERQLRVLETG